MNCLGNDRFGSNLAAVNVCLNFVLQSLPIDHGDFKATAALLNRTPPCNFDGDMYLTILMLEVPYEKVFDISPLFKSTI